MQDYTLEYKEEDGTVLSIPFTAQSASGAFLKASDLATGTSATLKDDHGPLCRIERASKQEVWKVKPIS